MVHTVNINEEVELQSAGTGIITRKNQQNLRTTTEWYTQSPPKQRLPSGIAMLLECLMCQGMGAVLHGGQGFGVEEPRKVRFRQAGGGGGGALAGRKEGAG